MKIFDGIRVEKVEFLENYFLGSMVCLLLLVPCLYTYFGWHDGILGAYQVGVVGFVALMVWFAVMIRPDHDPLRVFLRKVAVDVRYYFRPNGHGWWWVTFVLVFGGIVIWTAWRVVMQLQSF